MRLFLCRMTMHDMPKNNKYDSWFELRELHHDLKGKSITGGVSTSAYQLISFALNLLATFVLARMLLPSDFGLVGMVTAFTGFAAIIQDLGLSMAVIQKDRINHQQVSNLFWINVAVCVGIGLSFVLFSPLIVDLYHHDTRIYPIIFSYAAGISLNSVAIQHNALLSRQMKFGIIARGEIMASALSVVCGIGAALLGMGYWAIVIMNISSGLFYNIIIWILCDWRPSLPVRKQGIRDFLNFGAGISGFNVINYFSRNADNVLIGQRLGPAEVGFYSKAFQLLMLPLNQLRNPLVTVAVPAMSSLKNDAERYINYYRRFVFILAFFSMPVVACLALFSPELIRIVLGTQWAPSSTIFRGLALSGFIQPVASSIGLVMISSGYSGRYFIWGCINASITILGFLIGIHWGVMGVVLSMVITTYGLLLPSLWYSFKGTPLRIRDFFREISQPFLHTIIIFCLLWISRSLLKSLIHPLALFFLTMPTGIAVYYFSWKLYPSGRKKIKAIEEVFNIVHEKYIGTIPVLNKAFYRPEAGESKRPL